jgi:MtN3 and saliva related transmembrane protein
MDYSIFDDNVSATMNVFLVIGNVNNLIYNIPQIIKTYKSKSTKDFSTSFLCMRVFGNFIWLAYSIELRAFLFIISNIVSLFSSMFVCYYKIIDIYKLKESDNALIIYNKVIENDDNEIDKEINDEIDDENGF